jgi:hypothetical protein
MSHAAWMLQRPRYSLETRREHARLRNRERQRRLKQGIAPVNIEVTGDFLHTLIRLRYLREQDAHDSTAIAKAIECMHKSIIVSRNV